MLLEISELTVRYGGITAIDSIELGIEEGHVLAILGANGAGKSSLLHAIMGTSQGTVSGRTRFRGNDIAGKRADEIVRLGIAMSPEGRQLFSGLTVNENLEMGAFLRRDRKKVAEEKEEILDLFPRLRERLKQMAGTLSGGEQQMVAVGRALMTGPRLLLLDEPTLGLAPVFIDEIMELITKLRHRGLTVIVVEQNAAKALARSDSAYVMEKGKIVLSGRSEDLAKRDDIVSAYLGAG